MSEELVGRKATPQNPAEILYFIGLTLFLLSFLGKETVWNYNGFSRRVLNPIMLITLSINMISVISQYKKGINFIILAFTFIITLLVGYNASVEKGENQIVILLAVFLLVFGAIKIDFRNIIKIYLIVGGSYCIITVIASLLGFIENYSDISSTREELLGPLASSERRSFGYVWSTNFANHVFFIILTYFYYINRRFKVKEELIILLIISAIIYYTGSRLSAVCIILILLLSRGRLFFINIARLLIVKKLIKYCIPFFVLISFIAVTAFDDSSPFWLLADILLSGRLTLCSYAVEKYGIPMFGQLYVFFGSVRDDGADFNYLDIAYIQSLVIYGLIYTLLLVCAYVNICQTAIKRDNVILAYVVAIAGLSGLIAQHFLQIFMNPFLIALFSTRYSSER